MLRYGLLLLRQSRGESLKSLEHEAFHLRLLEALHAENPDDISPEALQQKRECVEAAKSPVQDGVNAFMAAIRKHASPDPQQQRAAQTLQDNLEHHLIDKTIQGASNRADTVLDLNSAKHALDKLEDLFGALDAARQRHANSDSQQNLLKSRKVHYIIGSASSRAMWDDLYKALDLDPPVGRPASRAR